MDKIYYSYSEFRDDLKTLITKIDKEFNSIITIARGGMCMGLMLGEYYNIREVYSINTIGYNDTQKLDRVEVFNIPNLKNAKKVLIVDDIVDSGDTLNWIFNDLKEQNPNTHVKTLTIYQKDSANFKSDYFLKIAKHQDWVDFFWSKN